MVEALPFRVDSIKLESDSVKSFYLVPEQGDTKEYLPGQFVTVWPEDCAKNNVRSYSLSDSYDRRHYRISVKRENHTEKGGLTPASVSNFLHDCILPGSRVFLSQPKGSFVLDPKNNDPITMIAGGIGITPFISAIETAVASRAQRDMYLFYSIKSEREFPFGPRLCEIAADFPCLKLTLFFTETLGGRLETDPAVRRGRPDLLRIAEQLRPITPTFYICGPSQMIADASASMLRVGIANRRIRHESFGVAKTIETEKKSSRVSSDEKVVYPVTFANSGKTVEWQPANGSLLDLASAFNVEISAGCRFGDCGTCSTRLISGSVRYRHATGITPDAGYCLPCSCEPETAITLGV